MNRVDAKDKVEEISSFEITTLTGDTWIFPFSSIRILRARVAYRFNIFCDQVILMDGNDIVTNEYRSSFDGREHRHEYKGKVKLTGLNSGEMKNSTLSDLADGILAHYEIENYDVSWYTKKFPFTVNEVSCTLWSRAGMFGSIKVMKYLITGCEEADMSEEVNGAVRTAIMAKRLEIVRLLLDAPVDGNGYGHLTLACDKGYIDIVKLLIQSNADVNEQIPVEYPENRYNGIEDEPSFPLRSSLIDGKVKIVDLLIEARAELNLFLTLGMCGKCTVLTNAVESRQIEIVQRLLLGNANPNLGENWGKSPLLVAAIDYDENSPQIVRILLEAGMMTNHIHNAFHAAIRCRNQCPAIKKSIQILLETGIDSTHIINAFQDVVKNRNKEIIQILLETGIDSTHIINAFQDAVKDGYKDLIQILLKTGIDTIEITNALILVPENKNEIRNLLQSTLINRELHNK